MSDYTEKNSNLIPQIDIPCFAWNSQAEQGFLFFKAKSLFTMQGFRFSLFYLCIFINNPVISIPSAVTLRSWSIRAKFPLLFPYIFFLLIFYPPIVPSRNTRLRFMISIISSCMLRISSGFILERRSRTASTFGILPLIQFFSLFDMLSGAFIF